eukprot:3813416-Rhodomonas_salina.1
MAVMKARNKLTSAEQNISALQRVSSELAHSHALLVVQPAVFLSSWKGMFSTCSISSPHAIPSTSHR